MKNNAGDKYAATRNLGLTEVAKLIRSDLKAAVKSGELPAVSKFSVRCEFFANGQSLSVRIGKIEGFKLYAMGEDRYGHTQPLLTDEANGVARTVKAIVNAYNYDNSDAMYDHFDTRFYSNIAFDDEWSSAAQLRCDCQEILAEGSVDTGKLYRNGKPQKRGYVVRLMLDGKLEARFHWDPVVLFSTAEEVLAYYLSQDSAVSLPLTLAVALSLAEHFPNCDQIKRMVAA